MFLVKKSVLFIVCLLSSSFLFSQTETFDIDKLQDFNSKYLYEGRVYSYKELSTLIPAHPEFNYWFNKANRRNTSAHIFGGIAIGVGLVGTVAIGMSCESFACNAVYVPLFIGAVSGIVTIIQIAKFNKAKQRSFDALSGVELTQVIKLDPSPSLNFGFINTGIGIGYSF